jgi:hypothetical protein
VIFLPAIPAKARNTEVGINHLPLSLSIRPLAIPVSHVNARGLLREHRIIMRARARDYPIIQNGLKAVTGAGFEEGAALTGRDSPSIQRAYRLIIGLRV